MLHSEAPSSHCPTAMRLVKAYTVQRFFDVSTNREERYSVRDDLRSADRPASSPRRSDHHRCLHRRHCGTALLRGNHRPAEWIYDSHANMTFNVPVYRDWLGSPRRLRFRRRPLFPYGVAIGHSACPTCEHCRCACLSFQPEVMPTDFVTPPRITVGAIMPSPPCSHSVFAHPKTSLQRCCIPRYAHLGRLRRGSPRH